jgi:vitamin B12 transporter
MRRGSFHSGLFLIGALAAGLAPCMARARGDEPQPPAAPGDSGETPVADPVAPDSDAPAAPGGDAPAASPVATSDDAPAALPAVTPVASGGAAPVVVVDPVDVHAARAGEAADAEAPAAARGLEDTAFVTEVEVRDHAAETTSVAEVLARTMGVSVRSLGGLGGFSSLSVRGADPGQTAVFIDGVPLSRIASATVNLEQFDLDSFSTLELYRGGVPVELGGAAIGGALQLRTRVGLSPGEQPWTFGAGGGSFAARRLRARWLGGTAQDGHHLALAYAGATGDFPYFDDNGTNLDPSDDSVATRANNHFNRLQAVARKRWQRGDLAIEAGSRWSFVDQGIPGSATVQAQEAELTTLGQLADVSATRQRFLGSPRLVGTASGFVDLSWQRYRDPLGEIGVGVQDRTYRSASVGASGRVHVDLGPQHLGALGVEVELDHFRERDALATMESDSLRSHGWRSGVAASASHEWTVGASERLIVRPALRLDWLRTVPIDARDLTPGDTTDTGTRSEVLVSPRLSGRVRLAPGVAVKGSAGRYFRPPTVLELFGDRGFIVGDPTLPAETGLSTDLGLVLAPRRGDDAAAQAAGLVVDRVYLESAVFLRQSRHTIAFVSTAGTSGARDLGDSTARGIETGATVRLARTVTLSGNYTWLDTRQDSPMVSYDGKPLPSRPRHQIFGRVDAAGAVRGRRVAAWVDALWTTGNVLDRGGNNHVPGRRLLGAGVAFELAPGLQIGVEGKNLGDQRVESVALDPPPRPDLTESPHAVADFFGYPLPGRAFHVTAEWQP